MEVESIGITGSELSRVCLIVCRLSRRLRLYSNLKKFKAFIPSVAPVTLADLDPRLRIYADPNIEIWYAPMGRITPRPKICILGITPGWNQMRIAYQNAADGLARGLTPSKAASMKKPGVAFAGSMRRNLVSMLDEIGLSEALGVATSSELFGSKLLRTGSVLKYPVFKNAKNYSGASPGISKHEAFREMLDTILARELATSGDCLIIPLGKAVESALAYSANRGVLDIDRVLSGFPHPSGANGHRLRIFNDKKKAFKKHIKRWVKSAD